MSALRPVSAAGFGPASGAVVDAVGAVAGAAPTGCALVVAAAADVAAAGSAGAGALAGAAGFAAGASAAAAASASAIAITSPADTVSPSFTFSAVIVPAALAGTSIVALSDSSVTRPWSFFTVSPTATSSSMTGTSLSSPMSGTRSSIVAMVRSFRAAGDAGRPAPARDRR